MEKEIVRFLKGDDDIVTSKIKEEVRNSLKKYRFFHRRLFSAFPDISRDNKILLNIKDFIDKKRNYK